MALERSLDVVWLRSWLIQEIVGEIDELLKQWWESGYDGHAMLSNNSAISIADFGEKNAIPWWYQVLSTTCVEMAMQNDKLPSWVITRRQPWLIKSAVTAAVYNVTPCWGSDEPAIMMTFELMPKKLRLWLSAGCQLAWINQSSALREPNWS